MNGVKTFHVHDQTWLVVKEFGGKCDYQPYSKEQNACYCKHPDVPLFSLIVVMQFCFQESGENEEKIEFNEKENALDCDHKNYFKLVNYE
jgi:hypothetical protein